MKAIADSRLIAGLRKAQGGVFSTADLRSAFAEPHPAALGRRIRSLIQQEVLFRFTRGFYVTGEFDLPVLSQRIAPASCISFETVLARTLVIGPKPERRVVATKVGRPRRYSARGFAIEHVSLSPHLSFGCESVDGVRMADTEKAALDVLYFHLRGRRYAFDIYSDMNLDRLNRARLKEYLRHYANPRFRRFAERVLELT
ncbi:MAG: hypothetical protein ABFS86_15515 [Planctomycetota bacterium]